MSVSSRSRELVLELIPIPEAGQEFFSEAVDIVLVPSDVVIHSVKLVVNHKVVMA